MAGPIKIGDVVTFRKRGAEPVNALVIGLDDQGRVSLVWATGGPSTPIQIEVGVRYGNPDLQGGSYTTIEQMEVFNATPEVRRPGVGPVPVGATKKGTKAKRKTRPRPGSSSTLHHSSSGVGRHKNRPSNL